jgi:hypothetical protein
MLLLDEQERPDLLQLEKQILNIIELDKSQYKEDEKKCC